MYVKIALRLHVATNRCPDSIGAARTSGALLHPIDRSVTLAPKRTGARRQTHRRSDGRKLCAVSAELEMSGNTRSSTAYFDEMDTIAATWPDV